MSHVDATAHRRQTGEEWRRAAIRAAAGVLLAAAVLAPQIGTAAADGPEPTAVAPAPPAGPPDLTTAIVRVASENIPAVVHLQVTERRGAPGRSAPVREDAAPPPFFGLPEVPRTFKRERRGLGSGVILDADGHVLTNAHVVAGATEIQVVLASGERFDAALVGVDAKTDLAVVKIPGKPTLPRVVFGDSDRLEVGEWVVAIGHPRGLDQTVTQGIISAKHRHGIRDPNSYEDFLQTDAAINPGNSGGPLLNLAGQVIGINAVIATASGGSEGIGFAIPSNMAAHIARQLIARGRVERGWLGIATQPVTPELARSLGLAVQEGALVLNAPEGGPAAGAGIKPGDVVVAYRGDPIHDDAELRREVAETAPGQIVPLRILSGGKTRDVPVEIADLDAVTTRRAALAETRLGASVAPISSAETELYKLKAGTGVVVVSVDPKGPLGEQGVEAGDVILEIGGRAIDNVETFGIVAAALPKGEDVPVLAVDHRTGEPGYLQLRIP